MIRTNYDVYVSLSFANFSGVCSVDRVVTSDIRSLRLKSGQWQNFKINIFTVKFPKKENEEKETGNGPFKKSSLTLR